MSSHEAATGGFTNLIQIMESSGFFESLLPFVVTYVLFFLTLKRIPLFNQDGDDDRFAAILSVVFAFFVAQFLVTNPVYQQFLVEYLGTIAITVIGLLGLLVVLAFIGLDVGTDDDPGKGVYGIILTGIVILAFFITGGGQLFIPDNINNEAIQEILSYTVDSGLIWILLVAGIIYWTLKDPNDDSSMNLGKLFSSLEE